MRPAATAGRGRERNAAIDAGRMVCCLAVVLIHSADSSHFAPVGTPTPTGEDSLEFGHVLDQLARFAVPYFFIASGYLQRDEAGEKVRERTLRLLLKIVPVYLFWLLVMNIVHPAVLDHATSLGSILRLLLQGGSAPHLWFLPSIAASLIVLGVLRGTMSDEILLGASLLFFAAGLLIGPYFAIVFGREPSLMQLHFARDVFVGPPFVAFGIWLRRSKRRPAFRGAVALFAAGAILQLGEAYVLWRLQPNATFGSDFLAGTVPFGFGAFMVAVSWPAEVAIPKRMASLGIVGLGVYAIHPLFIDGLGAVIRPHGLGARLIVALCAASLSFAAVTVIARWRPLRWAVM